MDGIARYEEAYTTAEVDVRIVRIANTVERTSQRADGEDADNEKNGIGTRNRQRYDV